MASMPSDTILSMLEKLLQNSQSPARVRSAIDKLRAAGKELPNFNAQEAARFVQLAENSRFGIEILRFYEQAWDVFFSLEYEPPPIEIDDETASELRKDLALSLFHVILVDVLELQPFEFTLKILSATADRAVQRALKTAWHELEIQFGRTKGSPDRGGFCVFGLGKLGGEELNFLSDIDLIFLYRDDGETEGGRRAGIENSTFYTKLANRIVELLSSKLLGPVSYRVDLRLRPEGDSGPVVRSITSTLIYYQRAGSAWERQAWIKARVIAGETALGTDFMRQIESFVFRKYLDRDAIYQIEGIKARIEAQVAEHGRRHVKLAVGGIREIEFLVQIFQLSGGGRCLGVRSPSTLTTLDNLVENQYLIDSERDELLDTYLFLRQLEHRLQMLDGRQTHLFPEDANEADALAVGLGFENGGELWKEYLERTDSVRQFFKRRFRISKEISITPIEEQIMDLLDEGRDPDEQRKTLESMNLTQGSMQEIRKLSRASIADPPTASVRRTFIRSSAVWMPMVLGMPDPDDTIKKISSMVEGYGAKSLLYEIFSSHPPVAELIVNIAGLSDPLSKQIVSDPSTLEALLSPGGVTGERTLAELRERLENLDEIFGQAGGSIKVLKDEESLRIGVRFVLGLGEWQEVGQQLSDLAELMLGNTDFAVLAMGRFGGQSIGPTSDLDLVFVTDQDTVETAKKVQIAIEGWQQSGLKIDARLRPMGQSSPLVCHVDSLKKYFDRDAQTWERLAWSRARVVQGEAGLCTHIRETIDGFLFGKDFTADEITESKEMRKKILAEAKNPNDLKKGRGGLIDLDFAAAILRLLRKKHEPDLMKLFADYPELSRAYSFLRVLDVTTQFVCGRVFRGNESESELAKIGTVMKRHDFDFEEMGSVREKIAAIDLAELS
ncbi:MAG: hypothetical protein JKX97_02210 [Candidatus Lindowbacteria bacterium]|nr:hypothetical protein [Candidatus Lindowbacteria bacterium]